ncbi:unnamed protein product [Vitrella brassicaformis CCMP3155]|uniref:Uncharacterized protein n=2 Tax=Vitrella brassicaformis TaxID=1169539 RepID=A0A0G4FND0_VITBC|nr:unnamed protein product [Vitrella brassicaformis CCMP3155]|eukprot:CEM15755.1 unnamed protein product [Vitrella brassicaformis CCMP3155]
MDSDASRESRVAQSAPATRAPSSDAPRNDQELADRTGKTKDHPARRLVRPRTDHLPTKPSSKPLNRVLFEAVKGAVKVDQYQRYHEEVLDAANEKHKIAMSRLGEEVKSLMKTNAQLVKEVAALTEKGDSLKAAVTALEDDLAGKVEAFTYLSAEVQQHQEDINELKDENQALRHNQCADQEKQRRLQEQNSRMERRLEDLRKAIEEMRSEEQRLEEEEKALLQKVRELKRDSRAIPIQCKHNPSQDPFHCCRHCPCHFVGYHQTDEASAASFPKTVEDACRRRGLSCVAHPKAMINKTANGSWMMKLAIKLGRVREKNTQKGPLSPVDPAKIAKLPYDATIEQEPDGLEFIVHSPWQVKVLGKKQIEGWPHNPKYEAF